MPDDFTDALFIAQTLIQRRAAEVPLTREMIAEEVARALAVEPRWRQTVDNDALCRELETRFNIWIGQEGALTMRIIVRGSRRSARRTGATGAATGNTPRPISRHRALRRWTG